MSNRTGLVRGQGDRPLLLYLGGMIVFAVGLLNVVFVLLMVVDAFGSRESGEVTTLSVNGLSPHEFLAIAPVTALPFVALVVLGLGLLLGRRWSRPLGIAIWIGIGLVIGAAQIVVRASFAEAVLPIGGGLLASTAAYLYFYKVPAVSRYYTSLGSARST